MPRDETGAGQFAVSIGNLAVSDGRCDTRIWRARGNGSMRTGAARKSRRADRLVLFPRLSPDGQKVAVNVRRAASRLATCGSTICSGRRRLGSPSRAQQLARLVAGRQTSGVQSPHGGRVNLYSPTRGGSGKPETHNQRLLTDSFLLGSDRTGRSRSCSGPLSRRQASGSCRPTAGPRRRSCSSSRVSSSFTPSSPRRTLDCVHLERVGRGARSTCSRIPGPARRSGFPRTQPRWN